jgi:hypothetical protein
MTTAKIAITIEEDVLSRLDLLVKTHFFPNRSKAIVSDHPKLYPPWPFENAAVNPVKNGHDRNDISAVAGKSLPVYRSTASFIL